jgi:hypothetical protein
VIAGTKLRSRAARRPGPKWSRQASASKANGPGMMNKRWISRPRLKGVSKAGLGVVEQVILQPRRAGLVIADVQQRGNAH